MEKLKRLSVNDTGKRLYEHEAPFAECTNRQWRKLRVVFTSVLLIALLIFLVFPHGIILFIILVMTSGLIISFVDFDQYSDRFTVYEEGFSGKIGRRPRNPNLVREWTIGQRFMRYEEINRIYEIHPVRSSLSVFLRVVRIDISPAGRRFSCIIPIRGTDTVLPVILRQIKRKGVDVKIEV